MRRLPRLLVVLLGLLLLAAVSQEGRAAESATGPPLSSTALLSRFARENGLAPAGTQSPGGITQEQRPARPSGGGIVPEVRVNQDLSGAPQNEPSIAVNPASPNMIVAGANDYRLGAPIGAAFYTSLDGGASWTDGFPPFPLLAGPPVQPDEDQVSTSEEGGDPDAPTGGGGQFIEPPFGTGDPVVAFGRARPGSSDPDLFGGESVVYYGYLGISASFCEHGIFVSRSKNGLTWTRPAVPTLLPRQGLFTPVYWDQLDDCSVFNDKPWIAVDRSGGPHDGRVYVVWARFVSDEGRFQQSTIEMAYSDDDAETWSRPVNVSGASVDLCPAQIRGRAGQCDESQFATAVVGPDGTLYVAFINQQAHGAQDGFRNQYLLTAVNPDTLERAGPYRAAMMTDGKNDFPVNALGQATLCNSNFRSNTAGNLAIDPSDPSGKTLYIVFADNRNGSHFDDHTMVTQDPPDSFLCPQGKITDTDIFVVRSTDGGVTWHNPKTGQPGDLRVNQDGPGGDQWFPFAAVSSAGRLSVVFEDRRDDPLNRLANVYVATSDDGGATWSETKVTSVPSNLNWAFDSDPGSPAGNGVFIGDYNGFAFAPDGTGYAMWTDSRDGFVNARESDVYMALLPP